MIDVFIYAKAASTVIVYKATFSGIGTTPETIQIGRFETEELAAEYCELKNSQLFLSDEEVEE